MQKKYKILILLILLCIYPAYIIFNNIKQKNIIELQKNNIKYFISNKQSNRILPHRVNSINKLKNIWNDSLKAFELDVRFGDDNTNFFQVGHDYGDNRGTLDTFLLSIKYSQIRKIWLDFKNLNIKNYNQAFNRLNYLDKKYKIKNKIIIESSNKLPFFKKYKDAGWHTSYYLPTDRIINLLKINDSINMKKLAVNISNQTKLQNISAISFDFRLYIFVKKILEPLLNKDIVYHTWDLSMKFYDKDLNLKLKNKKYFTDNKIKTILIKYKSI